MAIVRTRRIIDNAGTGAVLAAPEKAANEQGYRVVMAVVDPWGEVVGAIGTSGETPDEDEAVSIAAAGADFSVSQVPALTYEGARFAAEAAGAEAARRGVAPSSQPSMPAAR